MKSSYHIMMTYQQQYLNCLVSLLSFLFLGMNIISGERQARRQMIWFRSIMMWNHHMIPYHEQQYGRMDNTHTRTHSQSKPTNDMISLHHDVKSSHDLISWTTIWRHNCLVSFPHFLFHGTNIKWKKCFIIIFEARTVNANSKDIISDDLTRYHLTWNYHMTCNRVMW